MVLCHLMQLIPPETPFMKISDKHKHLIKYSISFNKKDINSENKWNSELFMKWYSTWTAQKKTKWIRLPNKNVLEKHLWLLLQFSSKVLFSVICHLTQSLYIKSNILYMKSQLTCVINIASITDVSALASMFSSVFSL